jgi:3-hydroxybutyryl-CoA dehydrogenase
MQDSKRIAVIGAGFMGTVIATLYSRHGYNVALHDTASQMLASYRERARPIAETLADANKSVDQILESVDTEIKLEEAINGAFLVHEVIQEVLPAKQELFGLLDRSCRQDVIIATNTSSFLLSDISRDVRQRDRVIGIHYITPAHVIRAVELIYADFTPAPLVEWGRRFLTTIDHVGVACRERPGFLINRLQFALLSEVYRIMDEGLASRDDVDTAVRLSLGPRLALWGPLLTEDLVVNKKTSVSVTEYLNQQTGDPNFAVRPVLRRLVQEGYLGAVAGKGWYEFEASYPSVVSRRDAQLKELLGWLQLKDPLRNIGIKQGSNGDGTPRG